MGPNELVIVEHVYSQYWNLRFIHYLSRLNCEDLSLDPLERKVSIGLPAIFRSVHLLSEDFQYGLFTDYF